MSVDKTLKNLCRLCGEERVCSFDIFMKTEDNIILSEIIENILNITITQSDTIPIEICAICHTFLLNFLKFRDTASKTQSYLMDLELNLEKEKIPTRIERKNSAETIKSEPSTTALNEDLEESSRLSFSSDDEISSLIKAAVENSSKTTSPTHSLERLKKVEATSCQENSQEETSLHSFSWDDENVPLIKVARQNSSKKITKIRKYSKKQKRDVFEPSVELSVENPLENPEECNICQKKFTKERYLRHHLRRTHKIVIEDNYPCDRCTRKFMQKLSLERHQKLHDDPNFNRHVSCDICGKFYSNKQTLKAHIRSIHVDIGKKYVCEECGAQFKGISSLKTHKITHTGEYPFECKKCDRRFQSKANLYVHLDTHTETPYVCEICQKPSTTLRGLRLHMINHSDEKPHKCHMCGNAYKRVTALKKHLIVHSGIKPYSCNFCERTFADGSNRRIHMRRVHKKELAEMEACGMKAIPAVLPKIQQLREDTITVQG